MQILTHFVKLSWTKDYGLFQTETFSRPILAEPLGTYVEIQVGTEAPQFASYACHFLSFNINVEPF